MAVYGEEFESGTPCPQLEWDGEKHRCGMMKGKNGPLFMFLAQANSQCLKPDNPWRKDDPIKPRTKRIQLQMIQNDEDEGKF